MSAITKNELNIQPQTIASAKPLAAKILQRTKDEKGFIPNMQKGMANNPALLDAYAHSYKSFRDNAGFTSVEQEVIYLSISHENNCEYCIAAHSFIADKKSGVPKEVIDAICEWDGDEILDEKLSALSNMARAITRKRGMLSDEDVSEFLAAGYTSDQLLGVIVGVGVKIFSNYFNHVADTPIDSVFTES